ncbi:hypothetical protein VB715_15545 [Crocosphaera sp. UHCC 0190]|uniref:ArnT family glycosyltransferase n=1 Tax=Crocosphaera sp. UHCC 0190 TaxID=3110246 RepID=UPI002B21700E|nr:hypothetical protein [Crocosphaera sp. UHCC 0190]MEA5511188.1 hypothetical protein [Crocosphaera sp. UHCC 0190]
MEIFLIDHHLIFLIMPDLIPLGTLLLLILISNYYSDDWRISVLSGSLVWGVLITLFTEIPSLFHQLTFGVILTLWSFTLLGLIWFYYRLLKIQKITPSKINFNRLKLVDLILVSAIILFIIVTGFIGIIAAPNNWDSMTYHLPRVMHWIQNHSVQHYPTYYSAQLVHPPFAEFAILNLRILSEGDRYVNLIQWLSMIGSVIGVSLIAKQLGSSIIGQILASIFCVTIPMGILQSTSTQNDYAVAYWLVCLAYFTLLSLSSPKIPLTVIVAIAASFSLAIFTKTSGYIYTLPFMLFLLWIHFNKLRWKLWLPFAIILVFILVINGNHYLRNFEVYGNPLSTAEYKNHYRIEVYSLPTLISNIIRNLSLHLDIVRYFNLDNWITPTTGISMKIIALIHKLLGVDVNDIRTTYPPNSYGVLGVSFSEDVAGNPFHLLLIILTLLSLLLWRLKSLPKKQEILSYSLIVISGFLLFCLMLKIQPYQSRHHLSIFVLFSPVFGLLISQYWKSLIVISVSVLLLVSSLQFLLFIKQRPLLGETNILNTERERIYFLNRQFLETPYLEAATILKNQECRQIGLDFPDTASQVWEYPLWPLTKSNNPEKSFRFQHFSSMKNESYQQSTKFPFNTFHPCGILIIQKPQKNSPNIPNKLTIDQQTYYRHWTSNPLTLFFRKPEK